jgi:hypothetical protein
MSLIIFKIQSMTQLGYPGMIESDLYHVNLYNEDDGSVVFVEDIITTPTTEEMVEKSNERSYLLRLKDGFDAVFLGYSRIDDCVMFRVDSTFVRSKKREDKINIVLS